MTANKKIKVLIALDYDPSAQKVAEKGFALAEAMNAEVTLLHVIAEPVYYANTDFSPLMGFAGYMDVNQMEPGNLEWIKNGSQHFLDKIKHHLGDASINSLVAEGDFADSILMSAKNIHADIIVIGSHSRKWLENIVMGSVTEEVLNKTKIPLFIIPTKHE